MSFPCIDATRRTDQSFRERKQPLHHQTDRSIIEYLPIDMIVAFPTSDPLHLLELGVMRKCLYRWIYGETGYDRKWNEKLQCEISALLKNCNQNMPTDIHRAIRGLETLKFWKGLEYRTILLYVGMVVFKEALNDVEFDHFMILVSAVTICSCNFYKKYLPIAKVLFNTYVRKYAHLYGKDSIGSNVHNLIHVVEDIQQLDVAHLNEISTYKYENCLRMLKMKIQTCKMPLEQIGRRIIEASTFEQNNNIDPIEFEPNVEFESVENGQKVHRKLNIKADVSLSARRAGDQWFLSGSGDVVNFEYVIQNYNEFEIFGKRVGNIIPYFFTPITSSYIHIYVSYEGVLDNELSSYKLHEIMAKMIHLNVKERHVFVPILHTLDSLSN